ncbi:hypothetical protein BDN72DRAFT_896769 [Pluteus cervinus]|uniref:Uncharacterized protein n=1 Tax=Pluteus cervinus TaxID=181527 RepID=A0ACD3AWI3_9AGAR|nr:hypothetical protein BDN72DRAFT_896769 [Pluteus cervinus]
MQPPPLSLHSALAMVPMSINATLGAVFVGFAVSCCIFGIFLTQVAAYFWRYPSDRKWTKFMVVLILLLEFADQGFIAHLTYYYGIENFAKPQVLLAATVTWSFILQLTVGAIVGAIVKASFAIRVWRFSERNIWITGFVLLLVFGHLGLAMTFAVKAFQLPDVFAVTNLRYHRFGIGSFNLPPSTSSYYANEYAKYNSMPHDNLWFIGVYFTLSKLYAISYLATLNTRRLVKGRGTDRQGLTSNNTNMFHLGTRMPSVIVPADLERAVRENDAGQHWDEIVKHPGHQEQWAERGDAYPPKTLANSLYPEHAFPTNSFCPGIPDNNKGVAQAY